MGCSGSRHNQAVLPQMGQEWRRYEEIVRAISNPLEGPTEEHMSFIRSCKPSALEPEDKNDPPLLALARDHEAWFRCLIKKLDPGVTWREGGEEKTLDRVLHGENFALWSERKHEWDQEHRSIAVHAPPAAHLAWGEDRWWSQFGPVCSLLGLGAAAGAGIGVGSAFGLGFPLMAVGPLVCAAVRSWQASFERCAPSPELANIFCLHAKEVGSTLEELNNRLQAAQDALAEDPGNGQAKRQLEREDSRVKLLRVLLERQANDMNAVAASRRSDKAKYDEMVKMLRSLVKFQMKMNAELMQEEVSDVLRNSDSRLESIEKLLLQILSFLPPLFSRSQSLALDIGAPSCSLRSHTLRDATRASSERSGAHRNVSFFCDGCSSSCSSR